MSPNDLFAFYERLYFQELDRRERLSARLNLPLAVLAGVVGTLSFMLQNIPPSLSGWVATSFWVLFILAALATATAGWFFRKSWFGHTDKLLPTANQTEAYRDTLEKHYAEFDQKEALVHDALWEYLYDYYMRFSSANTVNNDSRAYNLYRTTVAITVAIFLVLAAFIPFSFERYISDNPRTTTEESVDE